MNRMNTHHTLIMAETGPEAVLVPYDDYLRMTARSEEEKTMPCEVVEFMLLHKNFPIKAWRKFLGLTPTQVATRMGIEPEAYELMEKDGARLRPSTLSRIADAMGIEWELLRP